jgi:hypothetical protein
MKVSDLELSRINKAIAAGGAALAVAVTAGLARQDVATWITGLVNVVVVTLGTYLAPANTTGPAPFTEESGQPMGPRPGPGMESPPSLA